MPLQPRIDVRQAQIAHLDPVRDFGNRGDGADGAQRILLDGTDYFVSVVPVSTDLAEGMHWRFALFVPQNDIVSGLQSERGATKEPWDEPSQHTVTESEMIHVT